ncbi:MAG: alpha/beta fold hydrolase [Sphingomonadales bacterium]
MRPAAAPLLLLPGLMCDERIWAPQLREFAAQGAIAVPGYGDARSLVEMARRALAQAPAHFSLVGHSMGARVALEVFRLAPERVERLALLDTGIHLPKPNEAEKRYALRALGVREGIGRLVDEWLPPMVHPARRSDPALMEPLRAMAIAGGVERYEAQIEALLGRPDVLPLLGTIRCPTLVGVGRQDGWSPVEQHEAIAAMIPGAELAIFEDCGHMSPVEAPRQVNAALARWLGRETLIPTEHEANGGRR